MILSTSSQQLYTYITKPEAKLGDLRNIAKGIKKDHQLANEQTICRNS